MIETMAALEWIHQSDFLCKVYQSRRCTTLCGTSQLFETGGQSSYFDNILSAHCFLPRVLFFVQFQINSDVIAISWLFCMCADTLLLAQVGIQKYALMSLPTENYTKNKRLSRVFMWRHIEPVCKSWSYSRPLHSFALCTAQWYWTMQQNVLLLFISNHNTKLQLTDKDISTHTRLKF